MRKHRIITALAATACAAALTAPPAGAARDAVEQVGNGTWTQTDATVTYTGTTTGRPFDGITVGTIEPVDGTLPPWGGCEPGRGTLATSSEKVALTATLTGQICRAVAPTGYLVFIGWYDVTDFSRGPQNKNRADGRGGIDVRALADGSATWIMQGDLR
jgi:hypothetical protein